jgi:hypothetical protein
LCKYYTSSDAQPKDDLKLRFVINSDKIKLSSPPAAPPDSGNEQTPSGSLDQGGNLSSRPQIKGSGAVRHLEAGTLEVVEDDPTGEKANGNQNTRYLSPTGFLGAFPKCLWLVLRTSLVSM